MTSDYEDCSRKSRVAAGNRMENEQEERVRVLM